MKANLSLSVSVSCLLAMVMLVPTLSTGTSGLGASQTPLVAPRHVLGPPSSASAREALSDGITDTVMVPGPHPGRVRGAPHIATALPISRERSGLHGGAQVNGATACPNLTAPAVDPPDADVTTNVTIIITARWWFPNYPWRWNNLSFGNCSAPQYPWYIECEAGTPGSFNVSYSVKFPACTSTSPGTLLHVFPPLEVNTPIISRQLVDAEDTVTLRADITGGAPGPDAIEWEGLPDGCVSQPNPSISCSPRSPGLFHIQASVVDIGQGNVTSAPVYLSVAPAFSILSFQERPRDPVVGSVVEFGVQLSGGVSPFDFQYSGLPPGCGPEDSDHFQCEVRWTGDFAVRLTVSDAAGDLRNDTMNVSVLYPTSLPPAGALAYVAPVVLATVAGVSGLVGYSLIFRLKARVARPRR